RAIAAICASRLSMGRPRRRRSATTRANSRAARLSNGRMRPANNARTQCAAASRSSLRRPSGRTAMPYKISASDTAVVNRSLPRSRMIHRATAGAGDGFIASDSTLVSRTIIAFLIELRRLTHWLARERFQFDPAEWLNDGTDRIIEVGGGRHRPPADERILKDFARLDLD